MWEKDKTLVISIFFFSHNVFNGLISQDWMVKDFAAFELHSTPRLYNTTKM